MKNKKADVAITILVLGVVALCVLTLLSFYLYNEKAGKINKSDLSEVYTAAEIIGFSGYSEEYGVKFNSRENQIEKTYSGGGFFGFFKKDFLKVEYSLGEN